MPSYACSRTLSNAVDEARRHGDLESTVDAKRTAFELNGILIGAQWSYLMRYKDRGRPRSAILSKLGSVATDHIPAKAFDSVRAFRNHLESRHD